MMITHLTPFIVLLSSAAFVQSTRVIGRFGKEIIPIDFQFGDDVMVITSHKPENGHDTFRETSNLHVFSRRLVAIRNTQDKECYVQQFKATKEGMKKKVQNALKNKGNVGQVKEERVMVGGMQPLGNDVVELFVGPEIAKFCHLHAVYLISGANSFMLEPADLSTPSRGKRAVAKQRPSGDVTETGRGILPVRPRWCPCRYGNSKRRFGGWSLCQPMCRCKNTDVVIMC